MKECRAHLWGERVEQVVKSWNVSETKVKEETCVVNLAQRLTCLKTKPLPQPLLFLIKNRCMFFMRLSTLCKDAFFFS